MQKKKKKKKKNIGWLPYASKETSKKEILQEKKMVAKTKSINLYNADKRPDDDNYNKELNINTTFIILQFSINKEYQRHYN